VLSSLALSLACSLAAARADTAVVTLPGIEVHDVRPTDDPALRQSPGFARAYDVSRAAGRFATASEILAGGVGVHVRQYGGLGSFSAVSIRGSTSSQVAYFLDGVPLNQAQYGVVNASDLPLEALDRIEVYRGATPLAYDAPGGGAVDLVTRTTPGTWARGDFGGGSFGTHKLDASGGFARGRTSGFLVAQSLSSDGDFRYLDDHGTDANPADDVVRPRANNAFDASALTGRLAQGVGAWRLSTLYDRLDKDQGVPGAGLSTTRAAHFATVRDVASLRAEARGTRFAPAVTLWRGRQRDHFADPLREITGTRQDDVDRTTREGARAEGGFHRLSLLAEARHERYLPSLLLPTPRVLAASTRRFVALGAEQRVAALGGRLGLTGQARRELTFDALAAGPAYPGALNSPALDRTTRAWRWTGAAEWALTRGGRGALSVRTSAAWLGRTPTLEEMFGNRGSVHGNRDVVPERVATRDIGFIGAWRPAAARLAPRSLEGTLSAYRSDARDLLVFVPSGNASSVATNLSAARLSGVELSTRAAWAIGLTGDLAWTRAWSEDRGDAVAWRGKDLPGHPASEIHAALTCARTSWRAFAELHATSSLFLDRYNQTRVPARTRVDLGGGPQFPRHALDLTLECRNVGDVRGEDFGGYPLPGRSWALNARFHFDRRTVTP
jgi:outer membrane cobalamin receptor